MKSVTILCSLLFVVAFQAKACPQAHGLLDINCDGVIRIAAFGDSITRGVGDSTGLGYPGRMALLLPGVEIYNFGKPGEYTRLGRQRALDVFDGSVLFDYAVVLEGVNDYFDEERSALTTRNNLRSIVMTADRVSQTSALSKLTAVKRDFQKDWVNSVNSAISSDAEIDFFSLGAAIIGSDNLHPNNAGYEQMAATAYVSLFLKSQNLLNSSSQFVDSDNDGIWDFGEQIYGTNPKSVDSDSDGISDNSEVFGFKTDPLSNDSDSDGLTDFEEIVTYKTDPNSKVPGAPVITDFEYSTPLELR